MGQCQGGQRGSVFPQKGSLMHYIFGAYYLDTQRYELYHAGVLVPLRPKVFQVLAYLVAVSGGRPGGRGAAGGGKGRLPFLCSADAATHTEGLWRPQQ